MEAGGGVDTEPVVVPKAKDLELGGAMNYNALSVPTNVCDMKEVLGALINNTEDQDEKETLIIDSRGSSFANGHMPGAVHIPYTSWVSPDNTLQWKSVDDLRKVFADAGVDPLTNKTGIWSCGRGVSVCHTMLAMELCGRDLKDAERTKMYDGSWSEWGSEDSTPKTKSI